ncbi:MAG: chemotaxis protein CheW [Litoreibacter sp.]
MPLQAEPIQNSEIEFVTFSVSKQIFCLEIQQINEIRRWSHVTILPHAPEDVLGVMNLRGAVIPIYDLATSLGLGHTLQGERSVVIVSSVAENPIGLLVDSVSEIISVNIEEIQSTPDVASAATRECIEGIVSVDDQMARIVNLNSVIATREVSRA